MTRRSPDDPEYLRQYLGRLTDVARALSEAAKSDAAQAWSVATKRLKCSSCWRPSEGLNSSGYATCGICEPVVEGEHLKALR